MIKNRNEQVIINHESCLSIEEVKETAESYNVIASFTGNDPRSGWYTFRVTGHRSDVVDYCETLGQPIEDLES